MQLIFLIHIALTIMTSAFICLPYRFWTYKSSLVGFVPIGQTIKLDIVLYIKE